MVAGAMEFHAEEIIAVMNFPVEARWCSSKVRSVCSSGFLKATFFASDWIRDRV